MANNDRQDNVTRKLSQVSPCFCLAKWLQVTIDIVHGTTHSCHHPARHPIPLQELQSNLHALHNTNFKKQQRKAMLEGHRPAECVYCWDIEDAGSAYSDRIVKSSDPWALPFLDEIKSLPWDADVLPTYLEVMLDDRCNLSCAYCMADISSSIAAEMAKFGPYPVSDKGHRMPTHPVPDDPNPYVAAFWKWIPAVLPNLKVLRVTGGEPLLSGRLQELLTILRQDKHPDLTLIINSHLSVGSQALELFFDQVEDLLETQAIGHFELYTSLDAAGPPAEYIRCGMEYRKVMNTIATAARRFPEAKVVAMCAFNLLSLSSFGLLLAEICALKRELPNVFLDTAYLRNPRYLSSNLATAGLKRSAAEAMAGFIGSPRSYTNHEIAKIENSLRWMQSEPGSTELARGRRDFLLFVSEYDRRKNKSFLGVFPEYREFYRECKRSVLTT
ncbi:MAG: hypothetical protein A2X94_08055 [Bdellovibrionales bacterium GWB1_55_8]|nr:MAG: hypothetical protein A2X94_08055 [Bdellovibrionales bacterium GWB1_55_8]